MLTLARPRHGRRDRDACLSPSRTSTCTPHCLDCLISPRQARPETVNTTSIHCQKRLDPELGTYTRRRVANVGIAGVATLKTETPLFLHLARTHALFPRP